MDLFDVITGLLMLSLAILVLVISYGIWTLI